jgi:hypothetical protein
VNFLMVEIPTPKPNIFMIRVNRQMKCPKSWGPGSSPSPTRSFFLRIAHISETILSILTKLCPNVPWMILFQSYVRYVWGPKKGPRGGLKLLIILIFKNLLVNQQCQKIDTWHITLINFENRNPVWPNDFDLQLGCCISDAFSIFILAYLETMLYTCCNYIMHIHVHTLTYYKSSNIMTSI